MAAALTTIRLTQRQDYQFDTHFGDSVPDLVADEPAPLGHGQGPSPVQLLCAAVGNCLSASLLFSMRKYKLAPEPLSCDIAAEVGRNAENRLRVLGMTARLTLGVPAGTLAHLDRVLAQFEAFCTVTESIRQGIPVTVEVYDGTGARLK
ncbi:OsmC family protein [Sphaerotilus sp.]|uniref:OsmC family protein n=1 Tax=Sphaerotilus sp. TaxID=2093942 RepID=UPI002ACD6466|nr:OsmC family protein [Sphaerotilus sp.]MDZ7854926.1 OsmC family protein [Sphaerotilus sp.]